MTKEEIVEGLKLLEDNMVHFDEIQNDKGEWIDVHELLFEAIQALSQEPCDDAISRKDAEQMFRNIRSHLKPQDYKSAEEFNTRDLMLLNAEQMIHALPSVTHKSGKWIDIPFSHYYKCSECDKYQISATNYCPNCGAKMESEE